MRPVVFNWVLTLALIVIAYIIYLKLENNSLKMQLKAAEDIPEEA
jgi:hypothetical protein